MPKAPRNLDMSQNGIASQRVLGEDELRYISRNVKQHVPQSSSDDDINKLHNLLDSVLFTSASSTTNPGHRVAAWNTLCALIDETFGSSNKDLKLSLWPTGIWDRCFELYFQHSNNARPKSTKQLLGSLTRILTKGDQSQYVAHLTAKLCRTLGDVLCAAEVQKSTKASLLLFNHLFATDVIPLDSVPLQTTPAESTAVFGRNPATAVETLLLAALRWVSRADLASVIGQSITVILNKADHLTPSLDDKSKNTDSDSRLPPWARPLQEVLATNQQNTDAYRSHIFPALFKRSVPQYVAFLVALGLDVDGFATANGGLANGSVAANELLYAALQVGKSLGLVEDTTSNIISFASNQLLLPVSYTSGLVSSASRPARVAGLSLLVTSATATKPYEPGVLERLKRNLPHLHADVDSNFRSELFSLIQRMIDRLRASTAAVARLTTDRVKAADAKATLSQHRSFIQWYFGFLTWELRPTASYQRHISGLKCLLLLIRSGVDSSVPKEKLSKSASGNVRWPFDVTILDYDLQRLLLDLLMDPFDDVRQTAAAILELAYARVEESFRDTTLLSLALHRAIKAMLSSGRADHADGVAHMYALSYAVARSTEQQLNVVTDILSQTSEMVTTAQDDLGKAVDQYPLHGLLTSLRYVFSRCNIDHGDGETLLHLQRLVEHVWSIVRPTLCNDAPEGHVPEEMDEMPEVSTKDILSYCWRALKEASLLMGVMLSPSVLDAVKFSDDNPVDLVVDKFKTDMIDLCFRQLAELRHRGAFSTVAQTWMSCCSLMVDDKDSPLSKIIWYERTLKLLGGSVTINTRRSAGLPSLLCGILVTARSDGLFERAYSDLEAIARVPVDSSLAQGDSLTQVHAMNCMKDILKNTKLAERSERYVPAALKLAADSLRSDTWAIRNCGLMLFRAVIDRLLGTNDSYLDDGLASSRRVDFEQQPDLLEVVMELLVSSGGLDPTAADTARNEGVFPALQLLQRAIIPQNKHAEVREAVRALISSPSWHVRDKAARTYVSYVPLSMTAEHLEHIFDGNAGLNAEHGDLLLAKYLLGRLHMHVRRCRNGSVELQQYAEIVRNCYDASEAIAISPWRTIFPRNLNAYADVANVASRLLADVVDVQTGMNLTQSSHPAIGAQRDIDVPSDTTGPAFDHLGSISQDVAMATIHNAAVADTWLRSRAMFLDRQTKVQGDAQLLAWEGWARAVETSFRHDSVFSREAAASSLAGITNLWQHLGSNEAAQPVSRLLCLILYDLLNDDDEDVRILAATTTNKVLAAHSSVEVKDGFVPFVASQQLVQLMLSRWSFAEDVATASLVRGFNITASPPNPASQQLEALSQENHVLFAEEKQNLYIDEAREIRIWSYVASRVTPSAIPANILSNLAYWIRDALATLTDLAQSQPDGPLGSSSMADTFILGLQVIQGVGALLVLVEKGARIPVKPSELKKGLVDMLSAGRESGWSILWIREAERVLEHMAVRSMQASLGLLGKMGEGLESDLHLGLL